MKRITFRAPKATVEEIERLVEQGEYPNRSEVIRAATREFLENKSKKPPLAHDP